MHYLCMFHPHVANLFRKKIQTVDKLFARFQFPYIFHMKLQFEENYPDYVKKSLKIPKG